MMEPAIQSIADEYSGRVKVARIDIDKNPATAHRYAVNGVPTLLLFDQGQITETIRGAASKSAITRILGPPARQKRL